MAEHTKMSSDDMILSYRQFGVDYIEPSISTPSFMTLIKGILGMTVILAYQLSTTSFPLSSQDAI
jgi:hypothetical protein